MFRFLKNKMVAVGTRSLFDSDFSELLSAPKHIQQRVAGWVAHDLVELDGVTRSGGDPEILKRLSESYQRERQIALGRGAKSGADPEYAYAVIMESITLAAYVDPNLERTLTRKVIDWCYAQGALDEGADAMRNTQPFGITSDNGMHFLLARPPKK